MLIAKIFFLKGFLKKVEGHFEFSLVYYKVKTVTNDDQVVWVFTNHYNNLLICHHSIVYAHEKCTSDQRIRLHPEDVFLKLRTCPTYFESL